MSFLKKIIITVRRHYSIKWKLNHVKLKQLYVYCKSCLISHISSPPTIRPSPTGAASRPMVTLPGTEPRGPHVCLPVVPHPLHCQVPPVHGFPHHWPAALWGTKFLTELVFTGNTSRMIWSTLFNEWKIKLLGRSIWMGITLLIPRGKF